MEHIIIILGLILLTLCVYLAFPRNRQKNHQNKVHFYVTRDGYGTLELWLGKPKRWGISNRKIWFTGSNSTQITYFGFKRFGINVEDFTNLKWEDEPVEVFLNLKE